MSRWSAHMFYWNTRIPNVVSFPHQIQFFRFQWDADRTWSIALLAFSWHKIIVTQIICSFISLNFIWSLQTIAIYCHDSYWWAHHLKYPSYGMPLDGCVLFQQWCKILEYNWWKCYENVVAFSRYCLKVGIILVISFT